MRIIGIDVGINSVGYSYVDMANCQILEMGSRVFEAAENPKNGSSLALPRREARGTRRRLSRKAKKVSRLRTLLRDHDLPIKKHIKLSKHDLSPWQLRKQGLERLLTDEEFARVLVHFAKHPGFQTNRKSAPPNEETTFTKAGNDLYQAMQADGGKTMGSWLADKPKQRNDHGDYGRTIIRDHLREEIKILFKAQSDFGQCKATDRLCKDVIKFAFYRRELQSSLGMVGNCAVYENELRAAKKAYHAELFVALSRLVNLKILSRHGVGRTLTIDEIALFEKTVLTNNSITFAQARKLLSLHDDETFNLASYTYKPDEDITHDEIKLRAEKACLVEMKGFHDLRKGLEKLSKMDWHAIASRPDDLDQIAYALSFFESEDDIRFQLASLNLSEQQIVALLKIPDFSKTIDISIRAAKDIIPYLRCGKTYMTAVLDLCPDHLKRSGDQALLPPLSQSTKNPIVDRSLSQIRKVVNALIRKHSMPDYFHVETARELGRNFKDRKKIEAENNERKKFKDKTRKHALEIFGYEPNGDELARFRLWKEQKMYCPYSGEQIKPHHLSNGTDTQIDHILPYSRSFDDSWSNKILCFSAENQAKQNLTAWEYMDQKNMTSALEAFAKGQNQHRSKKLLIQDFNTDKEKEWKSRHLNDTRYVARALAAYLEQNLLPNKGVKKIVRTRKGALTSKLRHLWGLPEKDRDNDHRHHGVDAVVIACATQSMVGRVARWNRYQRKTKNDPGFFADAPWENFRKQVLAKRDEMFVTRQPSRKTKGQLHDATIKSLRENDDDTWRAVKRIKLPSLKLGDLKNIIDVDFECGNAIGRNAVLYNVLHERLTAFDNDPKKAFAEPIYMPLKAGKTGPNGENHGPEIKRVRVYDNAKAGFRLPHKSIADNSEMAWTEVYEKDGKFYLLPIYTWQVATKKWPKALITAGKDEANWPLVDETYDYHFSLYKNDFVRVEKKSEIIEGFFKGTHRGTAAIRIEEHKGSKTDEPGTKTLKSFKKYNVGIFGDRTEVKESAPWRGEP